MIEGEFSSGKADGVTKFKQQAKEILKGIDPRTAVMQISAKLGTGDDYKEITEVIDVWTQEEKSVTHKPG